jgi:hypothetical protein
MGGVMILRDLNPRLQVARLPDGRLHLHDGPIDLILCANGPAQARDAGYRAAILAFAPILNRLCAELPLLRSPVRPSSDHLAGPVAQRMHGACAPLGSFGFITPMAAVAGSVAEEVLAALVSQGGLSRASINNGGDIAYHLEPGASYTSGLVDDVDAPHLDGATTIGWLDPIRGVATSGRGGRSFSLGIADAVTVLAASASQADAAATVIANAVDLPGHPAITRARAQSLQPDSDLGERLVTRDVGPLTHAEIGQALDRGAAVADALVERGLAAAAALRLRGQVRIAGTPPAGGSIPNQDRSPGRALPWPT